MQTLQTFLVLTAPCALDAKASMSKTSVWRRRPVPLSIREEASIYVENPSDSFAPYSSSSSTTSSSELGGQRNSSKGSFQHPCWAGDVTYQRCCERHDITCWDSFFSPEMCCNSLDDLGIGASGNELALKEEECWAGDFTEERCCHGNFTDQYEKCWDHLYTETPGYYFSKCCLPAKQRRFWREDLPKAIFRALATKDLGPCPADFTTPNGQVIEDQWARLQTLSIQQDLGRKYGIPVGFGNKDDQKEWAPILMLMTSSWSNFEFFVKQCGPGTLTMLEIGLPMLEKKYGFEDAVELYQRYLQLKDEIWAPGRHGAWPHVNNQHYPQLLGFERHPCPVPELTNKIYMYNKPEHQYLTDNTLTCYLKMAQCSASVTILRYISSSACLTPDPEEAELFLFPTYEAC